MDPQNVSSFHSNQSASKFPELTAPELRRNTTQQVNTKEDLEDMSGSLKFNPFKLEFQDVPRHDLSDQDPIIEETKEVELTFDDFRPDMGLDYQSSDSGDSLESHDLLACVKTNNN